jgi:hypothetical protein
LARGEGEDRVRGGLTGSHVSSNSVYGCGALLRSRGMQLVRSPPHVCLLKHGLRCEGTKLMEPVDNASLKVPQKCGTVRRAD